MEQKWGRIYVFLQSSMLYICICFSPQWTVLSYHWCHYVGLLSLEQVILHPTHCLILVLFVVVVCFSFIFFSEILFFFFSKGKKEFLDKLFSLFLLLSGFANIPLHVQFGGIADVICKVNNEGLDGHGQLYKTYTWGSKYSLAHIFRSMGSNAVSILPVLVYSDNSMDLYYSPLFPIQGDLKTLEKFKFSSVLCHWFKFCFVIKVVFGFVFKQSSMHMVIKPYLVCMTCSVKAIQYASHAL